MESRPLRRAAALRWSTFLSLDSSSKSSRFWALRAFRSRRFCSHSWIFAERVLALALARARPCLCLRLYLSVCLFLGLFLWPFPYLYSRRSFLFFCSRGVFFFGGVSPIPPSSGEQRATLCCWPCRPVPGMGPAFRL